MDVEKRSQFLRDQVAKGNMTQKYMLEVLAREVEQHTTLRVAEDCARMCDEQPDKDRPHQINGNQCDDYITGYGDGSGDCAKAIREKYCK